MRPRNTRYNGRYQVPTLQQVIDLTRRLSRELNREVGIYPETKHPSYFRRIGLPLEKPLVRTLRRNGLNHAGAKVFIQSFEVANLKKLHRQVKVPLVQLLSAPGARPYDFVLAGDRRTYRDLATSKGLRAIARYAQGVAPSKDYVIPLGRGGRSLRPTTFVTRAHSVGLVVHPYTFRRENQFLPAQLRRGRGPNAAGDLIAEIRLFLAARVDAVFTDNPDLAVKARG